MNQPFWRAPLALCIALLSAPLSAHAATFAVTNSGDSGPGSLRQAITDAGADTTDSTIVFSAAMFNTPNTIALSSGQLSLSHNTSILGPGARLLTITSDPASSTPSRIFNISGGTVSLSGMTISGGRAVAGSATGGNGGGILNAGQLSLSACAVSGNTADLGGGILNLKTGTLNLSASTVSGNSSTGRYAGGIYNVGTLTLFNSTVAGNTSASRAGGIYNETGSTGTVTISSSTVSGNSAQDVGGVLNDGNKRIAVSNSIIAQNTGLIYGVNGYRANIGNDFSSGGFNLISNDSGSSGFANGTNGDQVGNSDALLDARLGEVADNGGPTPTVALLSGSPAFNAANPNTAPATDQRGQTRGTPDIGAFEAQPFISNVPDQRIARGQGASIAFTLGDSTISNPAITGVSVSSSDQNIIPDSSLTLSGSGANRTLSIGNTSTFGTSTITLTVTAGTGSNARTATDTFEVRVTETPSLVVTTNSDASTDFDSQTSLREAVFYARSFPADQTPTVSFAADVTGTITLNGTNIDIARPNGAQMNITGPGAGVLTISGDGKSNIFADGIPTDPFADPPAPASAATIAGLTFSGGDSSNAANANVGGSGEGGAIDSDGMTLTISDCAFSGNHTSDYGGAIDADGSLTLARCVFTGNVSDYQNGAVNFFSTTQSSASDCTFSGNSARSQAGAIGLQNNVTGITRCKFLNNTVENGGEGGAVYVDTNSITTFSNCTFTGNSATLEGDSTSQGGAVYAFGAQNLSFVGCTFSGNAANEGGALYVLFLFSSGDTPATIVNCTLVNNSAGDGSAIYSYGNTDVSFCTLSGNTGNGAINSTYNTLSLGNTILNAGTSGANLASSGGIINSNGYNLSSDDGGDFLTGTGDLTSTDPKLDPNGLQNRGGPTQTLPILPNSPAFNAADPDSTLATDQRGVARPQLGRADIGAFEIQATPSLIATTFADEDNGTSDPNFGSGTSLREAMFYANSLSGSNTISFNSTFDTPQTITLQNDTPLPGISGTLTLSGPSVGVVIQGRMSAPLLTVQSGASATMTNIGFSRGKTGLQNNGTLVMNAGGFSRSTTGLVNTGTATLSNVSLQNSSIGINNTSGTLTLLRGRFGGITQALVNANGATAAVGNSTFAGNAAGVVNLGRLTLGNSTFAGNGDAVRNGGGAASLVHCTLVGNTNSVLNTGGAGLTLNRCTVTGNGTGLKSDAGQVLLRNTLLVGNGQNLSATLAGNSLFNITGTTAQGAGLQTDGNGFPVLKDNGGPTATVALVTGSRAINAADPGIQSGTDQRGLPRVVGGRADIGAFEVQTSASPQKSAGKPSAPSS